MNNTEKEKLYADLINFYGEAHQCMVCIEELSELIKELVKYERGMDNHKAIAEEIADVTIMLEQIIGIYDVADEVGLIKAEKLQRTEARLLADVERYKICATKLNNYYNQDS